jgi:transposase
MQEHALRVHRLCQMPGVDVTAAHQLLAEIGPTAATFPSAEQLASWVGVCRGKQESAGVNTSSRSAEGNRYLRRRLCQIAWASTHSKGTFFAALFLRWRGKLGAKSAAWAVAHRITKIIWAILHKGLDYVEQGETPVSARAVLRKFRKLVGQLKRAGINPQPMLG